MSNEHVWCPYCGKKSCPKILECQKRQDKNWLESHCFVCGEFLTGMYAKGSPYSFCKSCMKCVICKGDLDGSDTNTFLRSGKLYCREHGGVEATCPNCGEKFLGKDGEEATLKTEKHIKTCNSALKCEECGGTFKMASKQY